jgi:PAS domain S-box-containing protein
MGDGIRATELRERELEAALQETEQLTRGILSIVPAGVVHVAADGAILTANAEALHLLGMTVDELTCRVVQDFTTETIWEDGSPCVVEDYPVTRALATGETQPAATIGVRRPDGNVSWCDFRAVPVKDARGAVTGAVVTIHDITERKQIENALRRSEAELKAIVESTPSIIFTADRRGTITFVNRIPRELLDQLDTETAVGGNLFNWVNERDRGSVEESIHRVLNEGAIVEIEADGLDGVDPNVYSARVGPIARGNEVVGVAGVVSLITERKREEQERMALLSQLYEARRLEALGRLAGGIAHDFNNLLTVIRGNLDALRQRVTEPHARKRVEEIGRTAVRASELTRQLLAFGRGQALAVRPIDLGSVIGDIADMLRRLMGEHVQLIIERDSSPGTVLADPTELERVVVNLAMNAQDAMPHGGTLVLATYNCTVAEGEIAGVPAGRYVVLETRDTGTGMDRNTRERIFEPFFTTKKEGTGLGLATVHGIVKQSDGYITVESESQRGTRVRAFLPRLARPSEDAPASHPSPASKHGGETILIVEDDPNVRQVARRLLESEGYQVIVADNAAAALAYEEKLLDNVELLLSDMVMPLYSGPEVAATLCARAPHLRVLFMSGHAGAAPGELPPGADFIAKPFDARTLTASVRALLDR